MVERISLSDKYRLILLSYKTTDSFKVIINMPYLFQFNGDSQKNFYVYVVDQLLNHTPSKSDIKSLIKYFTTLEEDNIRNECSVSLFYHNNKWIIMRDIKKGVIKVDLNNIWFVTLLQYGDVENNLDPRLLFHHLKSLNLVKNEKKWRY